MADCYWHLVVETCDAAQQTMRATVPYTENYPVENSYSAEFEKSWLV